MKKIIFQLSLLFFLQNSNATPKCVLEILNKKNETFVNLITLNSLKYDSENFAFFSKTRIDSDHPYKFYILDDKCTSIYQKNYDDHPLSLFVLSDIGDGLFSISMSANSYIVDVFYFDESNKVKLILHEYTKYPPSFFYNDYKKINTMPSIRLFNNNKYYEYFFKNGIYVKNNK